MISRIQRNVVSHFKRSIQYSIIHQGMNPAEISCAQLYTYSLSKCQLVPVSQEYTYPLQMNKQIKASCLASLSMSTSETA